MTMSLDDFEPDNTLTLGADPDAPRVEIPQEWSPRYSDEDKRNVAHIVDWLNATGRPQVSLARLGGITPETFSQVLRGKYQASPAKFLAKAIEAMANETERAGRAGIPFVETTVWRLGRAVYHRARTYRNMGVFTARSGLGKTDAARHYARTTPNVYLVECLHRMSSSAFLDDLIGQRNLAFETKGSSKEAKFIALIRTLKGTDSLVIVDEAENLGSDTLEYCRRIRDLANVGVVLQGKPNLIELLGGNRFDQIRNRIGFWPRPVQAADRSDADEIAIVGFADLPDGPDRATLDALWEVCGGNLRLLTESLIPAVHDFGLRRGRTLTPQLVRQVAAEALGLGGADGKAR